MPLCPQITNTPITVTQTADFTVSSVLPVFGNTSDGLASTIDSIEVLADGKTKVYRSATEPTGAGINDGDLWIDTDDGNKLYVRVSGAWISAQDASIGTAQSTANAAASAADAAQSTANTALANAATAYTTAQNSLQPSAYAIQNPTTKQLTAIDATGLTVYSGASATTGARVVLNSTGLAGFNSGGTATFSISASTGAAVFSGSVTGSTITGGTLNIAGNAIIDSAGLLTATGATITGTINATAGYFGTALNGFSIGSVGLTGVGSGAITGGKIQTSSGTNAVILDGSTNSMYFKYLGSVYGHILPATSGSVMIHYGATADPTGGTYPQFYVGGSAVYMAQSATRYASIDSSGLNVSGDIALSVGAFWTGTFSSSSTDTTAGTYISQSGAIISRRNNQIPIFANRYNATGTTEMIRLVYNGADAGGIQTSSAGSPSFRTTSDYRLKNNIQDYIGASDIIKSLRVRSYEMNNNPGKTEIGFIAHEYAETVPDMVNGVKDGIDADGNPEYQSISTTNLIPYIVGALKEALLRIETLEGGNK